MVWRLSPSVRVLCVAVGLLCAAGCGNTVSRSATEQLLESDAVDRAIADIDFTVLSGKKVYFDTNFLKTVKGRGFVNADYIISSLRQQMVAARCLLQDSRDAADYIVEGRVGTLGTDGHDVIYGLPASNGLTTAASLVPSLPAVPTIPELSIAKKSDHSAAAKVALFAYRRETGEPVWQSGISYARSSAKDLWVAGAGPFQSGSIYRGPRFAGARLSLPKLGSNDNQLSRPAIDYTQEYRFAEPPPDLLRQAENPEEDGAAEGDKAKSG